MSQDTAQAPAATEPESPAPAKQPPWFLRSTLVRHVALFGIGGLLLFIVVNQLDLSTDFRIAIAAYYVCAVAGITVLTGVNGQISLGHGALMAIGAYTATLLFIHQKLPLVVVLLISTLVTAAVGALVGAAAARLHGPYLAGATLALAVGLPALAHSRQLQENLGGDNGLSVPVEVTLPPATLGEGFPLERWWAWVSCLAAVITLFLLANLIRSKVGRQWRAVRDDDVAAALAGINVQRTKISAFVVSAACAGIAGALLAFVNALAAPGAFPLALSLSLVAAAVLGGIGSLSGAVYGSIILALLPKWSENIGADLELPRDVYANLPLLAYGAVLILVILLFPYGLQGGLVKLWRLVRRRTTSKASA